MNKGIVFAKALLVILFATGVFFAISALPDLDKQEYYTAFAKGGIGTLICFCSFVSYLWVSVQPGAGSTDILAVLWVAVATIAAVVSIGCLGSFLFDKPIGSLSFTYPTIGSIAGILSITSFCRMLKK